jgi:hypothetical protein
LTPDGISPNSEKIAAIMELPEPVNLKQVLTLLQTGSWYRRFVPNFASVARPLSDLTKRNAPWIWSDAQKRALNALKMHLTTAPILRQADCTKEFVLKTDANGWAIAAVLAQGEEEDDHPVEYTTRLFTALERKVS